ncbi:PDZ domain-containing protein [Clostridium sp.]|uniref:PDZ domain-containing protein n=1 Tax=Clostridium sp. TaxID=1506 RepID=UPI003217A4E8
MELLKYTLQQVSYAIVEPSYALILIMMAFVFYTKNKKTTIMEKLIMGKNSFSAFELTVSQIVMGILGGVVASLILTHLGVAFYEASNIFLIFIISVALMFFNPKLVCFSYSGAILGLCSIWLYFLSLILDNPSLNILKMDITNLLIVVGVMHLVEGLLVILDGKRGAIPVFGSRDKKIIGGFAYRRQWILPMIILLMVQATGVDASMGGRINTPDWWPLINHSKNVELFATMLIGALPLFAGVNYGAVTFTKNKNQKPVFSGMLIFAYGVLIIMLSSLGNINEFLDVVILVLMPVFHEYMLYFDRTVEKQGKAKYVSNDEGVCVLDVAPNSIGKEMGIKMGDLILEINDTKLHKDEVIFNILENLPKDINMKIRRSNGDIRELSGKTTISKERLGVVIVPREVPKQATIAKPQGTSFAEVLKKIKEKKDNNNKEE